MLKKLLIKKGYSDVIRIGGAGDRGVDLIARDIINPNKKILFQCKRWTANVDSTPIQRLHSMKTMYGDTISQAVCISTSNYTREAQEVARLTGVNIINGLDIIKELDLLFPGQYYHGALNL
jgi:restriction endonuclease Mrr